jgi:hypothetical protein
MIKMDITTIALYVGIAGIIVTGAYQIYKRYYLDDGKITLDETTRQCANPNYLYCGILRC